MPTLLYIACAEGAYAAVIVAGMALGGGVALALGLTKKSYLDVLLLTPDELLYALAVSALVVFVIRVRDLLGAEVFGNFLIGRYRRPVREQRIFLFLDVLGSTAFAEIHGDLRAQEYLAGIFAALAEPVRRTRGAIYDYFGDMAMISWPFARGVKDARCVACVFEILREIEIHRDSWRERFGQVPQFRAALHGGPGATAEVGVDWHKISYFGDVLNATGRMEALCRTLEAPILISGARASYRFLEFFTAKIRNPHTRRAYARAAVDFGGLALAAGLSWLGLNAIAVLSKALNRDKAVI